MTDTNNGWPDKPGVPLNPEQSGWHWIYDKYLGPECALWIAKSCCWQMAGAEVLFKSDELSIKKWGYLAPCLTLDEATALQARVAKLEKAIKRWVEADDAGDGQECINAIAYARAAVERKKDE